MTEERVSELDDISTETTLKSKKNKDRQNKTKNTPRGHIQERGTAAKVVAYVQWKCKEEKKYVKQ